MAFNSVYACLCVLHYLRFYLRDLLNIFQFFLHVNGIVFNQSDQLRVKKLGGDFPYRPRPNFRLCAIKT